MHTNSRKNRRVEEIPRKTIESPLPSVYLPGMGYTLDLKSQHRYTHGGRDFNNFKELCDDSLTILGYLTVQ